MSDRQMIADLLSALEYHAEQTRPIHSTTTAIQAAREHLSGAAPAPVAQYGWVWVDVDEGGCFVYPHEHHPKDAIAVYTAAPAPVLTKAQALTDEQIDRAVAAWFEGVAPPHDAGPKFRSRMRAAIEATGQEGGEDHG